MNNYTHIAFADETNYNGHERYGAFSVFTLEKNKAKILNNKLKDILKAHKVSELKWYKIGKDIKYTRASIDFFKEINKFLKNNESRIDTVCWDYHDERHKINKRDDIANFHRMIHHLLKNTLTRRWNDTISWGFFPDENAGVDWDEVKYFLNMKNILKEEENLFNYENINYRFAYNIITVKQLDSIKFPLIQATDLFAGIEVFSRNKYKNYKKWLENSSGQMMINFDDNNSEFNNDSKNDIKRFEVLKVFLSTFKTKGSGISFDSSKGLKTYIPNNKINFWWYTPQNIDDKAPTK